MLRKIEKRFPDFRYWFAALLAALSVAIPAAIGARDVLGRIKTK